MDLKYLKIDRKWQKKPIFSFFLGIFVLQMELIFAYFLFYRKGEGVTREYLPLGAPMANVLRGPLKNLVKSEI